MILRNRDLFVLSVLVLALAFAGSPADATLLVDAALTDAAQIRTAHNDPFFPTYTEDLAAVNLSYGTPTLGFPLNGIAFHDLELSTVPRSGTGIAPYGAASGVTLDFVIDCDAGCGSPRNLTANIIAADPVDHFVVNRVRTGNRYISNSIEHRPNIVTFHGLGADRDVYVQLIGGQHGWNGNTSIFVNGDGTEGTGTDIGVWQSNKTSFSAGLAGFEATTKPNGDLVVEVQSSFFGGIAGLIVSGESATPPGPPATAPAAGVEGTPLLTTSQLRSATNNPPFAQTLVAAGVNLYYTGGSRPSGPVTSGTVNGIAFDNIDLWDADALLGVPTGPIAVGANMPGVTVDLIMPHENPPISNDRDGRDVSVSIIGPAPDAAALNEMVAGMRYMNSSGHDAGHDPNVLTFAGLPVGREVHVQLVGGSNGWDGVPEIFANGASVGDWTDNPGPSNIASISEFLAMTDGGGNLDIELVVNGAALPFSGLSGAVVLANAVPEPSGILLLAFGLATFGLAGLGRSRAK